MNRQELENANIALQQREVKKYKRLIWILIGILVGIICVVLIAVTAAMRNSNTGSGSYPYIPQPRNTIHSTSFSQLAANIFMDMVDTGIDYSVISRSELLK